MNATGTLRWCQSKGFSPLENVALDEAILVARAMVGGSNTLRFWRAAHPLAILPSALLPSLEMVAARLKAKKIPFTRALGGKRALAAGPGFLNYSFVVTSPATSSEALMEEIHTLQRTVAQTLATRVKVDRIAVDAETLRIDDKVAALACAYYYFDLVLLRGCILVDVEPQTAALFLGDLPSAYTSLAAHSPCEGAVGVLEELVVNPLSTIVGLKVIKRRVTARERQLVHALRRWKYDVPAWVRRAEAPLALGKVLLEAYVAYPPTRRCRKLIRLMREVARMLPDRVETRVWMRGKGLQGWEKGQPPGLSPSPGICEAAKKYTIPAVVVHGVLRYRSEVPSKEDLLRTVNESYERFFGGKPR